MSSLKDKTIIVTGGGRGIGAAACKLLAYEGANVVITCRTAEEGIAAEKDILSKNLSAKYISHDVSKEESWQNVIEETLKYFPQIDAVVKKGNCEKSILSIITVKQHWYIRLIKNIVGLICMEINKLYL